MADPLPASPTPVPLSRRAFLRATVAFGGGALVSGLAPPLRPAGAAPGLMRQGRPTITHGVQSGDVTDRAAVVWARADRPGRLWVEVSGNESFRRARRVAGPWGTEETDFTAQTELHGLPSGEDVFYRVWFESDGLLGETVVGHLRTAPRHRRHDVSFVWSGDTAGQGWGINPDIGGMRTYETMRETGPDFFIHCATRSTRTGPSSQRSPWLTVRSGATSPLRRSRRSPRPRTSSEATTSTTCSTPTFVASTLRFRCSHSGTTTRRSTTGTRARSSPTPVHRLRLPLARAVQALRLASAGRPGTRSSSMSTTVRPVSQRASPALPDRRSATSTTSCALTSPRRRRRPWRHRSVPRRGRTSRVRDVRATHGVSSS